MELGKADGFCRQPELQVSPQVARHRVGPVLQPVSGNQVRRPRHGQHGPKGEDVAMRGGIGAREPGRSLVFVIYSPTAAEEEKRS